MTHGQKLMVSPKTVKQVIKEIFFFRLNPVASAAGFFALKKFPNINQFGEKPLTIYPNCKITF